MIARLRLWLWEQRRKVLEHRITMAQIEVRRWAMELREHNARRPGWQRGAAAVTHRLWRMGE